jgi:hypothetical protein
MDHTSADMTEAAAYSLDEGGEGAPVLRLSGSFSIAHMGDLPNVLRRCPVRSARSTSAGPSISTQSVRGWSIACLSNGDALSPVPMPMRSG